MSKIKYSVGDIIKPLKLTTWAGSVHSYSAPDNQIPESPVDKGLEGTELRILHLENEGSYTAAACKSLKTGKIYACSLNSSYNEYVRVGKGIPSERPSLITTKHKLLLCT